MSQQTYDIDQTAVESVIVLYYCLLKPCQYSVLK